MKRIATITAALIILLAVSIALAEQTVELEDGRKVILKDDHTWQYAGEEAYDQSAEKTKDRDTDDARTEVTQSDETLSEDNGSDTAGKGRCSSLIKTQTDRVTGETQTGGHKPLIVSNSDQTEGFASQVFLSEDSSVIWALRVAGASPCIDDEDKTYILFTDGSRLSLVNNADFNCDARFVTYYGDVFGKEAELKQLSEKAVEVIRVTTQKGHVERELSKKQAERLRDTFQCIQQ